VIGTRAGGALTRSLGDRPRPALGVHGRRGACARRVGGGRTADEEMLTQTRRVLVEWAVDLDANHWSGWDCGGEKPRLGGLVGDRVDGLILDVDTAEPEDRPAGPGVVGSRCRGTAPVPDLAAGNRRHRRAVPGRRLRVHDSARCHRGGLSGGPESGLRPGNQGARARSRGPNERDAVEPRVCRPGRPVRRAAAAHAGGLSNATRSFSASIMPMGRGNADLPRCARGHASSWGGLGPAPHDCLVSGSAPSPLAGAATVMIRCQTSDDMMQPCVRR